MTTVAKLKAYKTKDTGLDPYAYLDADDAEKLLKLVEAANEDVFERQAGYCDGKCTGCPDDSKCASAFKHLVVAVVDLEREAVTE